MAVCCCRDVTDERKPFPSFAPEDFPAASKAAQTALKKAQMRAISQDTQAVRPVHAFPGWQLLSLMQLCTLVPDAHLHCQQRR